MELVKNMIDWGHTPNMAKLLQTGVYRPMIGVFPTLTPPGWTALSTGSWPGTHKVMDFNIRAVGDRLDKTVWGINTGLCQSEYLWNLVERVGGKPILVKWEMSWPPTVTTGIQVEGNRTRGLEPPSGCWVSSLCRRKMGGTSYRRDNGTLRRSIRALYRGFSTLIRSLLNRLKMGNGRHVPDSTEPAREVVLINSTLGAWQRRCDAFRLFRTVRPPTLLKMLGTYPQTVLRVDLRRWR